ncbi:hypothetical protein SRABI26_00384 [Arthrobacter sp. Bi26]|uniref:ATP-binding protein n=1 Tax=Arthrobacter sp. Bi26 TaxID=2822350 RepID=UPI001D572A61|nr:ATP-binding protein [Arthrobacter sp. Bi26]CAH0137266.1 hypothetical protein SRABI26_00384 [Arthrobacter sp. Bi26]
MTPTTRGLDVLDDRQKLTVAVSTTFDPLQLLQDEVQPGKRMALLDGLAAVCDEVEVEGKDYRQWRMRSEARQDVLRSLTQQADFGQVVDSIDAPQGDLFAMYLLGGLRGEDLSRLVTPGKASPGDAEIVDLDRLLKAVRLLEDIPGTRPAVGDLDRTVRRRIALQDADDALRAVIPERLIGRDKEYKDLLSYRAMELPSNTEWVPSLVIEGPGGVGKSALVSTFVYNERHDPHSPPLIYFDFDRAALIGARPSDLTLEFTRQLGLADDGLEPMLAEFRETSRALLGGEANLNIDVAGGSASAALRELGSLLWEGPQREASVTLVLDTFEELAIRGETAVRDVLQWAADLRSKARLPQLHLIVCGRAVFPDARSLTPEGVRAMFNMVDTVSLGDLSAHDATDLLEELGLDPVTAREFPPVFGGNPLVLKLIRRFTTTNDDDAVAQLLADGKIARRESPAAEIGLRFVYERILNRIRNPRVQALAYPGVVLRRVTPELILEVLAPASSMALDVTTIHDARSAFQELAEHVWLVNRIGDDTVQHRADVRRLLVPGLESSAEIDTKAIHLRAALYYARRPPGVDASVASIEEIYHRGFIQDVSYGMSERKADDIVRALGEDLEFWPLSTRARVKRRAREDNKLSEDEIASLDVEDQFESRGARLYASRSSGDVVSSQFEESQLVSLGTSETIHDSRWVLLFDRGEFSFMSDSSRALQTIDRYFASHYRHTSFRNFSSNRPTHEHPWFIALARQMLDSRDQRLLSDDALSELRWQSEDAQRYAAALAAIAGDRSGHIRIIESVRTSLQGFVDITSVDDVLILQAAAARGDLDDLPTRVQVYSYDHFRLSHVTQIAEAAGDPDAAEKVASATQQYARRRPNTGDINALRASMTRPSVVVLDVKGIRAAPTPLTFLYGAIRTTMERLGRRALLEVVGGLEEKSVFWPADQTAKTLDRTLTATFSPADLTGLIEMADRCGLLTDLIDATAPRADTQLAQQLTSGIRRLESLLFPFARSRGDLPSFR